MTSSRLRLCAAVLTAAAGLAAGSSASAQSDVCIGQLAPFAGAYCPANFTETDGKLLPISQYTALFSLLGTMYGGNGTTNFGVPDLRGRMPMGQGQGPGLPNYAQGTIIGSPTQTLTAAQMPAHSHTARAYSAGRGTGTATDPTNAVPATSASTIYSTAAPNANMASSMIGVTGQGQSFSTQSPVVAIRWCMAVTGIYCPRP